MARNAAGSWQTNALRLPWHATASSSRHGIHPRRNILSLCHLLTFPNVCKHISSAQLLPPKSPPPSRCVAAAGAAFVSTFAIFHSILFCVRFKSPFRGSLQLQLGRICITRCLTTLPSISITQLDLLKRYSTLRRLPLTCLRGL